MVETYSQETKEAKRQKLLDTAGGTPQTQPEIITNEQKEKLQQLDQLFYVLHDVVNDPTTRETEAPRKMHLIHDIALEFLRFRENEQENVDWTIRNVEVEHEQTKVPTHNVEVIIGDPKSGPSTVVMVHHDIIYAGEDQKDTSGKIPLNITEDGTIEGRTVQDNTIHLATMINSLDKLTKPESGALIIVFTDYEENGCRGSNAYSPQLVEMLSDEHPVAITALESTQTQGESAHILGIGHRGKFDGQVKGDKLQDTPTDIFLSFFHSLTEAQQKAFEGDNDLLGHTVGTATCGTISTDGNESEFWSKIDFRTNGFASAEDTANTLAEKLDQGSVINQQTILDRVKETLELGLISINVSDSGITITSESNLAHPSVYNPVEDETVLPTTYIILKILKSLNKDANVTDINWGDINKQNSNPLTATITGSFDFSTQELMSEINALNLEKSSDYQEAVSLFIDAESLVLTEAVTPEYDEKSAQLLADLLIETGMLPTCLNFMTDAGAPVNLLNKINKTKNLQRNIYPFVFGVGNPVRLHKMERVTARERLWFMDALPNFINQVQSLLERHHGN